MARGSRLARLAALGLLGVATLTGCSVPNNEFWRFGWPDGITEQSQDMRELWTGSVIAALLVGFGVWGLILWSVVRHRKRSRRAAQADGLQPAAGDRLHDRARS